MRSRFSQAALLFTYGVLYHFIAWRISVRLLYGRAGDSFANHPLTNATIATLGGISACIFMMSLIARSQRFVGPLALFARALLFGLLATVAAFQAFLLVLSFYIGGLYFFLAFIDVETYGVTLLALGVPFGLISGGLAGVAIVLLSRSRAANSQACNKA